MSRSWLLKIKLNFSVLFMAEKWGTTEMISSKNVFLSSSKFWHFMTKWYSSSISCLHSGQILCSTGILKCLLFLYWEYYCWYECWQNKKLHFCQHLDIKKIQFHTQVLTFYMFLTYTRRRQTKTFHTGTMFISVYIYMYIYIYIPDWCHAIFCNGFCKII
jgi:hypothetical protein